MSKGKFNVYEKRKKNLSAFTGPQSLSPTEWIRYCSLKEQDQFPQYFIFLKAKWKCFE